MFAGLFIIIGIILIVSIWTLIEQKLLVTTSYTILGEKLPKAFDGTGFIILSDLHNHTFGKNNQRLIRRIERLSPEFIIIAGDMINKKSESCPSNAYTLLTQLAEKYKIYYAYGNHEQRYEDPYVSNEDKKDDSLTSTWVEYKKRLLKQQVVFLNNKSIYLDKGEDRIRITGVTIGFQYFEHGKLKAMEEGYLTSLIGKKPAGEFELLIAHNPAYFSGYAGWGADFIISGHLHGGLIRLPLLGGMLSPQVSFFPKYSFGLYQKEESQMLVSRGLGSHSLMPRLFNVPEVVSVKLVCSDKKKA